MKWCVFYIVTYVCWMQLGGDACATVIDHHSASLNGVVRFGERRRDRPYALRLCVWQL